MTSLSEIQDFLAEDRIAVVGVSRNPQDFSRTLLCEFRSRGYETVAVNPELNDVDGQPCFAHVQDIKPAPRGALLMTSPAVSEQVVRECAEAGVSKIWMYRAGGKGAVSDEAVRFCQSKGMSVIPGECPFMFFPATGWFHRAHGFIRKITGAYPK